MSPRGILAVALLVPALALERGAYYASRSFLYAFGNQNRLTAADLATVFGLSTWLGVFASIVGGALAIALRPRLTTAIGALLATLGMLALLANATAGFYLVAVGGGIFRACLWASLAELVLIDHEAPGVALPANRFATLAGIMTFAYAALNFAAMAAPALFGRVTESFGFRPAFGACAAADVVAALLAGGAALAGGIGGAAKGAANQAGPYRSPGAPAPAPAIATPSIIGLVVVLLALGVGAGAEEAESLRPMDSSAMRFAALQTVNPATVVVVSFFACALWVAASMDRWSLPPLLIAGIGLAVTGLGVVVSIPHVTVLSVLGSFVTGAGEVFSSPVLYAYAALALPRRYAALAIASTSFVSTVVFTILRPLTAIAVLRTPLVVLLALVALAGGVALAALARKIHKTYFDPPLGAP